MKNIVRYTFRAIPHAAYIARPHCPFFLFRVCVIRDGYKDTPRNHMAARRRAR